VKDKRVTKVVVDLIKQKHPGLWQYARANSYTDDAGNRIHVREDGICWETQEWVDYDIVDQINDILYINHGLPFYVEYSNSYEVMVMSV
jgi:hypothetical protein